MPRHILGVGRSSQTIGFPCPDQLMLISWSCFARVRGRYCKECLTGPAARWVIPKVLARGRTLMCKGVQSCGYRLEFEVAFEATLHKERNAGVHFVSYGVSRLLTHLRIARAWVDSVPLESVLSSDASLACHSESILRECRTHTARSGFTLKFHDRSYERENLMCRMSL